MNRNELLWYVENVRNLETLRYRYSVSINAYDEEIAQRQKTAKRASHYGLEVGTFLVIMLAIVLVCGAIFLHRYTGFYEGKGALLTSIMKVFLRWMIPFFMVCGAIGVILGFDVFGDIAFFIRSNIEASQHNSWLKKNKDRLLKEAEEYTLQKNHMLQELEQVNALLTEAYSFNVIPLQFRKLEYAIYLYEYLSTSQETLESALLHSHMESAVKRILSGLNTIVMQNWEAIKVMRNNLSLTERMFSDLKLNAYYVNVNQYYLQSRCF